ncbi:lauroyl acyltransferase [Enterovibrio norvegicus FF-162]|uniref:ABC transporter ATP-binding protein n=1 Tax=Enterovibrio norvegicus TaxID=188144 RepID=UPI0002E72B7C|nr:ABC transporter ATP-binding protein [Enterovibrio norvegicus]OEE81659.1 lauroyl acyltransferase [Enterovibrio norvegicus FF-162]
MSESASNTSNSQGPKPIVDGNASMMEANTPIIEAKGLWKEYGSHVVIERLNIKVMAGEFISILGTSGCGKSTFLNMLLGTQAPSRGQLLLDGEPLSSEPGPERGIVFQKYSVFPHMTALQNIMVADELEMSRLTGRVWGSGRAVLRDKAMAQLEKLGLAHAADKYPAEMSGGMQQRLAIAQALMKKPRILLLDEPFGALDPGIRKDMHELINQIWQEQNLTIFMITHDLHEGFKLGSRLWVFDKPRFDPQAPERFGSQVTFDIPLNSTGQDALIASLQAKQQDVA